MESPASVDGVVAERVEAKVTAGDVGDQEDLVAEVVAGKSVLMGDGDLAGHQLVAEMEREAKRERLLPKVLFRCQGRIKSVLKLVHHIIERNGYVMKLIRRSKPDSGSTIA